MKQKFSDIKEHYEQQTRGLLQQGMLPFRHTQQGVWGVSQCDETFSLFNKVRLQRHRHFLDLGSGDGRVTLIASLFTKATGIEIDPALYQQSLESKRELKSRAAFVNGNFLQHDLTKYDALYSFPDTPLHRGMEQKLKNELQGRFILVGFNVYPVDLKEEMKLALFGQPVTVYKNE